MPPLARPGALALLWLYTRWVGLAYRTTRWTREGFGPWEEALASGRRFVIVNWHGQLALMPYAWDWERWNLTILTTDRPIARMLAAAVARKGVHPVPMELKGRRDAALRTLMRAYRNGHCIGITPDGPLGPARVAKPGAVEIAGMLGAEIAPIAVATRARWRLKSWDRFEIPGLFTRGAFVMGPPLVPPPRPSPEALAEWQRKVEQAIDAATARAEEIVGR